MKYFDFASLKAFFTYYTSRIYLIKLQLTQTDKYITLLYKFFIL